jgi:hypothetical protein
VVSGRAQQPRRQQQIPAAVDVGADRLRQHPVRRDSGGKSTFGIRHTNGARVAIQEARTALGLAWRYMDAFETEAAALYAAPMELDEMRQFASTLVKADDKAASVTARRGRQQQASSIVKLWMSSPTIAPIIRTQSRCSERIHRAQEVADTFAT